LPNNCNLRLPWIALYVRQRQLLRCRELPHRFGLRHQWILFCDRGAVDCRVLLSHAAGHLYQRQRLLGSRLPEHSIGAKVCLFSLCQTLAMRVYPNSSLTRPERVKDRSAHSVALLPAPRPPGPASNREGSRRAQSVRLSPWRTFITATEQPRTTARCSR